jgi:UDP-GlcNAc:undecaprenyl-phosphate GlcNAc-1-phosphate transferase
VSQLVDKILYMAQFVPIMAFSFLASYGFTPLTRKLALHLNIVDQPSQRKIHREPIPLLGGVAIYGAFMLAVLLFTPDQYLVEFGAVLAGSLWLAVVGYIDDRQGMNPRIKMSAQIIAGVVVMAAGIRVRLFDLHVLNYLLTLFWIVGITNAINLMDNMDGLAAGFTTIAAGTFCVLAASQELILVASLSAALCGATLGFLRYNFNPATTFMGDTGSLVIGFVLAVLGIKLNFPAQTKLVTWSIPLMVLAIPIFDTTLVTFTRLREKRPITQGGKDHTSHRLVKMGFSHRKAVVILYGAGVILGSIALAISQIPPKPAAGMIALVGIVALALFIALERSYMHSHE